MEKFNMKIKILILALFTTFCCSAQTNIYWTNLASLRWPTNVFTNFLVNSTCYHTNMLHVFSFEPSYDTVTNIVISKNYQGTIQIGTNFYRINTETNITYNYELKK